MANLRTAINRGAFDFVTKPVDLSDLEITVRKALANIAKLREMDRLRAGGRAGAQQSGSLFFARTSSSCWRRRMSRSGPSAGKPTRCCLPTLSASRKWRRPCAEAVMAMLREIHARMTARICACGGTVDKYIGDAIVAVFGVPNASSRRRRECVAPAPERCSMRSRALESRARVRRGGPGLAMGISVDSGPAVVGDVGSEHGMSFTVIGDTVNAAETVADVTRSSGRAGRWRRAGHGGQRLVSRDRGRGHGTNGRSGRAIIAGSDRARADLDAEVNGSESGSPRP